MAPVTCPAPNCVVTFQEDLPAEVLLNLIQLHARTAHPIPAAAHDNAATTKPDKIKRPTVTTAGTSEDWAYFVARWAEYKTGTKLTGADVVFQLLECTEESLRKDLTRTYGSLAGETEAHVLQCIKSLAVRPENLMVARVQLQNLRQDRDEPVRAYCARLRGQASVCQFVVTKKCTCELEVEINYSDEMVRDSLIRGLEDDDIRLEILAQPNQKLSLDETLQLAEAKESGKRSAGRLLLNPEYTTSANASSSYSKQNKPNQRNYPTPERSKPPDNPSPSICFHCGRPGHGNGRNRQERKKKCPAFNHTCTRCGKLHHHESVCRMPQSNQQLSSNHIDTHDTSFHEPFNAFFTQDAIFDQLCSTDDNSISHPAPTCNSISLDHHIYNDLCKSWQKRKSDPQPCINIKVQAIPTDYSAIGVMQPFKHPTPTISYSGMADTGCQSCLAGLDLLHQLSLQKHHLIPVNMQMTAANNKGIEILGAIPLRITGVSPTGSPITTRQIIYITPVTNRLFLSKLACIRLGLISSTFPTIGETLGMSDTTVQPDPLTQEKCQCPRRTMPPPPPTTLPYPPTEENRGKLEQYLLEYYKSSTFNVCEHQTLPMMAGPPMRLMIDPNAIPFARHKPIPIPVHWQRDIYAGLDQDVRLGVIEPVPVGTPVTWCHRMVIVPKKSGKPRRTVDLQPLNKYAVRETHHTESPFHQARSVPSHTYKSVFDAWHGYHSIELHEEDRHLTTFITPRGRFRYRVAPQGYIASGDGYTRRFDEIVMDFPRKTKCVDDAILWSSSIEEAFFHAVNWLDVCGSNGIVLNPSKFVFAKQTVEFAGFEITPTTVRPCPRYLTAIKDFPTPQNITDIRSWFGLVNQVSYAFASAERMLPFRNLLKPDKPFEWNDQLEELFNESKSIIIKEIRRGVEIFDKTKPTCLATDWCRDGIGYWLLQKHCSCSTIKPLCCKTGWKVTLVGSRFTSSAESRYAPVEGEALAVVYALHNARHFVLGCSNLIVAVDHKPLLKVLGDRSLENINNPRLLNLKEKTLQFRFSMVHVPGVRHAAADAVSRHPISDSEQLTLPDDIASVVSTHDFLLAIRSHQPDAVEVCGSSSQILESVTWDEVRLATTSDEQMRQLVQHIEDGFPDNRNTLHPDIRPYYQYRDSLTTFDGVILYRDRVVIPPLLRDKVLTSLHAGHQGVSQMCSRVECSVFWPGITPAINDLRAQCTECDRIAPSQPNAPPTPPIMPAYPFQCIASDYFSYIGHHYLIIVDRYSNWPIVEQASDGAQGLISALRSTFVTFGIAEELTSDGGPEYTSKAAQTFLQNWGTRHRRSSVAFAHSNSRAEIGVKTVKRLIMENTGRNGTLNTESFQRAMLQYRNTPDRDTGLSPAMCVFGRAIRDFIPVHPGRYLPHPTWRETLLAREEALRNRHQKICERLSEHTRPLPPLVVGDTVRVQNQTGPNPTKWDKTGIIVEVRQYDQYIVRIDGSGRVTLRNRKFLRKYIPVIPRHPLMSRPGPTVIQQPPVNIPPPAEPAKPQHTVPTTPPKQETRIYTRSQSTIPSTPKLVSTPPANPGPSPAPTQTPEGVISPNSIPSDEAVIPSTPVSTTSKRMPLALKQLQSYNAPGASEETLQPVPGRRSTRSATKPT